MEGLEMEFRGTGACSECMVSGSVPGIEAEAGRGGACLQSKHLGGRDTMTGYGVGLEQTWDT